MTVKKPFFRTALVCFLVGFLFAIACSRQKLKLEITAEERLAMAMKLFEKHDYLDAKTQFRIITLSYGGSTIADKAQYYTAECHFFLKEYILAASEYERLARVFPNSEYVDDAKFKLGLCYYKLSPKYAMDQEYTMKAIKEFREFLEDYDSSPLIPEVEQKLNDANGKLAHKLYAAADQYRKMGYYTAAIVYFNIVLERYFDTKFAPDAHFWLGECYYRSDKYLESREAFEGYLSRYPHHQFVDRAKSRLAKIPQELEKQLNESLKAQAENKASGQ